MITLSSPALLFDKQKIFRLKPDVEKAVSGQQYRLIIVFESTSDLPPSVKEMADKMIVACNFKLKDALYVNIAANKTETLDTIRTKYKPELVLIFGNLVLGESINSNAKNSPVTIGNTRLMTTQTLETIYKDKSEKAALWTALQLMLKG